MPIFNKSCESVKPPIMSLDLEYLCHIFKVKEYNHKSYFGVSLHDHQVLFLLFFFWHRDLWPKLPSYLPLLLASKTFIWCVYSHTGFMHIFWPFTATIELHQTIFVKVSRHELIVNYWIRICHLSSLFQIHSSYFVII